MKRASSLRLTLCPMPPIATAISGLPFRGLARLARRVLDRLHDVHVAGASAEVAGDRLADLKLARVGIRRDECRRGHHHPGRAETALQAMLLVGSLLDGSELVVFLKALDRRAGHLIGLYREDGARFHRPSVEQDGARPAVRGVA